MRVAAGAQRVVPHGGLLRSGLVRALSLPAHDAMTGSSYENYSVTSQTYDSFRQPISLDLFRQAFGAVASRQSKPASAIDLLDAGCGSGNYLAAVKDDVGTIAGLEFNEGMIGKAVEKLPTADIRQGSITSLPYDDESFDVVMTTQVLHHLEKGGGQEFANVKQATQEVFRCLRPGGAWIIQTQTPEQHVDGFWWAPIVPDAALTLSKHFAPLPLFEAICRKAGFGEFSSAIPPEPLVRIDKYLDIEAPFKPAFRNADSTWSLASEAELEKGLAMLRAKIDAGEADAWLAEREALRSRVGQTTTVVATKLA